MFSFQLKSGLICFFWGQWKNASCLKCRPHNHYKLALAAVLPCYFWFVFDKHLAVFLDWVCRTRFLCTHLEVTLPFSFASSCFRIGVPRYFCSLSSFYGLTKNLFYYFLLETGGKKISLWVPGKKTSAVFRLARASAPSCSPVWPCGFRWDVISPTTASLVLSALGCLQKRPDSLLLH